MKVIRPPEPKPPTTPLYKARFVATKDTRHDGGSHRIRSPIAGAAVVLGIYIAMYLAVAGVVHVLALLDAAAAVAPDSSMAPSAAATTSSPPVGEGDGGD
jgi:hypothetical protein